MVRSVIGCSLLKTIFLFCVSVPMFTSISTSHARRIHLGNETDRLALLAFKHQLLHDPLQVMSSWNESAHFCLWEGVTCGRRHQRVVQLDLMSRQLVGPVSPYIGNLSFLRVIIFENNTFQGNIPQEISWLSRLEVLSLSFNSFTGQIPTTLVQCSKLLRLYLYYNKLVGGIPEEFGSFPKLVIMYLDNNNLTGRIPTTLGNLSSLQDFDVSLNKLEGSVPDSISQWERLTYLGVGGNMLSGTLPPSIYNLSNLQNVAFADNQLEGSLPPSIGHDLPNLRGFYIGKNKFSGSLPVSLFTNASRLSRLDVAHNSFVGQVPIEVGNIKEINILNLGYNYLGSGGKTNDLRFITSLSNCSNLELLSITFNTFGGRLPASLANLSIAITKLYLGNNQLFGSIPSNLWKLKNLLILHAPNNSLTGTIPKDIGMLQTLQELILYRNRLSGKIPSSVGNLTSLYAIDLSDNMLEGIDAHLWQCRSLGHLYISNNRFTGTILKQILGLSLNLLHVDLSSNYLTGSLPQEVGELKNLQSLNLSENKLSSEIPPTIGSCFSLVQLHLAGNSFQGNVPPSFGSLVSIEVIDLSRNNLSGTIPKDLEKLLNLKSFNISFNKFKGEVPAKGIFENLTSFAIDGNDKLCGGPSELNLPKCHFQKSVKKKFHFILKVTVGVLISLSVILALVVLIALHLRKKQSAKSVSREHAKELQRISYNEIREATNGFSSSNLIGMGNFASVYKGVLRESGVIAVKVFNLMERGASKSFKAECEILRKVRHRNLLKILTVCSSIDFDGNDFKALILEFLPNGSLEDWLHQSSDESQRSPMMLNILHRLNIAIDVASALDYLHNCNDASIVHGDLKPSNVLLDEDFVAHVGDFGLAKFIGKSNSRFERSETDSIAVRGTVGYIPPEYGMGSAMSTQGDAYSYGIMLLEMFTGRRPTHEMFSDTLSLHDFCKVNLVERDMDILHISPFIQQSRNDIIDDDTEEQKSMTQSIKKCFLSVIEIGVACSSEAPYHRMEIREVLTKMQQIKVVFLEGN